MGDIVYLKSSEVQQLLHNKFVVILGDSVQRSVYKDLVLLLQKDCLLTLNQLKAKGEMTFEQDKLREGGQLGQMHNGTSYREVREFRSDHHLARFYFLTRVYSEYLESILEELQSGEHAPDVVIMNSCLWDISRYGQDSWRSYLENLENLFRRMGQVLPESCLLVWSTTMPVGEKITGAFLPEHQTSGTSLKASVVEANFHSSVEAKKHNFDVLDLHFHFRHAREHLQPDGVHWDQRAHRHLSQLLLAHLADAWGVDLPARPPAGNLIKQAVKKLPGQRVEAQSQASRDRLALLSTPLLPAPRRRTLLQSPPQRLPVPLRLPPQPPLIPLPQGMPQFPNCPQDAYFYSDHTFQSDQFYFHSDVPSSAQTGFSFEASFMFDAPPPVPYFPPPCYRQPAPVVHRGFPRYLPPGPYAPSRQRPRPSKRRGPSPRRPQ
ncbi:PC-esterase domain-containing protein 1B [Microcebus murinus]|uniref:PC-esterase domain containing 1B n=1 Tax=Microcebus murinus TaxID=30608 RepID=A0A8B7FGX6_MICMU|nr:PC-esterase domain-containing protein 1B [Microcebus murinus]XP_012607706.1 PC-esterase domain-containing protein 1B [Microcebus murinus]XP_020143075.1 PC-esterase domain-containing protein 1B [Microcebus murinus]XP_020143076.1 PC-esterase domain-containing protein 1B [Microcebus murinus]